MTVTIRSDGKCSTYRGTFESGTLLGTSATAFVAAGAFRYLQVGYNFTDGTYLAAKDALHVLSTVSGGATSSSFARPALTGPLPWAQTAIYLTDAIIVDDFYVNDAVGHQPTYFSGDVSIVTLSPVSVAFHLAYFYWLANSGSDVVAPVDDAAFDGDATYIYTRDAYSFLAYQMETLADDGRRVDEVQVTAVARLRGSSWTPQLAPYLRRWDGINLFLSDRPMTSTAYRAVLGIGGPAAGVDWTVERVNASRFGVRS